MTTEIYDYLCEANSFKICQSSVTDLYFQEKCHSFCSSFCLFTARLFQHAALFSFGFTLLLTVNCYSQLQSSLEVIIKGNS